MQLRKNDNIKNVEKVPIETEKVPIEVEKVPIETEKVPIETGKVPIVNLSTQQRAIFQFVKENGKILAPDYIKPGRNIIGSETETSKKYS